MLWREDGLGAAELVCARRRGAQRRAFVSAPNWEAHVRREHLACRGAAALFDQSSFAKFEVAGADAEAALSWICANDVRRRTGKADLHPATNARGGIECDLTVARLAHDRFYIVTGTGFATHDFQWIQSQLPPGMEVTLTDRTEAYSVLSLMKPRARK